MDNRSKKGMKSQIKPIFAQIIKFGIVGLINNIICLIVYYIVVAINPRLYLIGNALGFVVSTINAYIMNSRFVFNKEIQIKTPKDSLIKTYIVYTLSLCINTGLMYLLVDVMEISEKIAPIISLFITIPLNFVLNKFWVYRKKDCVKENSQKEAL